MKAQGFNGSRQAKFPDVMLTVKTVSGIRVCLSLRLKDCFSVFRVPPFLSFLGGGGGVAGSTKKDTPICDTSNSKLQAKSPRKRVSGNRVKKTCLQLLHLQLL